MEQATSKYMYGYDDDEENAKEEKYTVYVNRNGKMS